MLMSVYIFMGSNFRNLICIYGQHNHAAAFRVFVYSMFYIIILKTITFSIKITWKLSSRTCWEEAVLNDVISVKLPRLTSFSEQNNDVNSYVIRENV